MQTSFNHWLAERRQSAQFHRQLLVISGPYDWATEQALQFSEDQPALWFGDGSPDAIAISQYRQFLGQECPNLVFNAFSGLRASAMMALSGTVQAGGLMILVCPPLGDWPAYRDPELTKRLSYGYEAEYQNSQFIRWLVQCINKDANVAVLTPDEFHGRQTKAEHALALSDDGNSRPTDDQQKVLASVRKADRVKHSDPILITADRGRGKSSALGMAAAKLMQSAPRRIGITAPHRNTVEPVFRFSADGLTDGFVKHSEQRLQTQNGGSLTFYPPDVLLREKPQLDWLFIDEAAALPAPILMALDSTYSRKAYSTTIHGYEGSGRGFEVRFKPYLQKHYTDWQPIELNQPVRWAEDDALEAFWFRVMMSHSQPRIAAPGKGLQIRAVTQAELLADPTLTAKLFNLMVDAHYQTTPDDLVRLMDAPDARIYIAQRRHQLDGVLLIQQEGGAKLAELSHAIALGKRRLNGHLVAQNLAGYCANNRLATLNYWRVVRIAVGEEQRQNGIASALLKQADSDARQAQVDALSVSFGAQADLLQFWQKQQFEIARLGYRRDTASGEHNVIMLKPVRPTAESALGPLQHQFRQEFIALLPTTFHELEAELGLSLLQSLPRDEPDKWVVAQLTAFVCQSRPLEAVYAALKQYLPHWQGCDRMLPTLLFEWCYQCRDTQAVATDYGYHGKKPLTQAIRHSLRHEVEPNA